MAFATVWELIAFLTSLAASLLGIDDVLTQYGFGDTTMDLVFDTLGALVVAAGGTAVLSGLIDQLANRL